MTATFTTSGGSVTVSCEGSTISLVSASPADGYTLDVGSSGPTFVDVEFHAGASEGPEVHATCKNGQPTSFIDT